MLEEKEWRVKPYYKTELAQAYAPFLSQKAALNRLADWIKKNTCFGTRYRKRDTAPGNIPSRRVRSH